MFENQLMLLIANSLHELANNIEALSKETSACNEEIAKENSKSQPSESKVEPITLEKVRAVLAAKSQNGKQPEVKALITRHGGNKLTELDPSCYEELLKEAEVL